MYRYVNGGGWGWGVGWGCGWSGDGGWVGVGGVVTTSFYQLIEKHITFVANNNPETSPDQNTSPCFVHTNINEEGISISMALCVGDARRKHVYTSSTNEVEIHIINENQEWKSTSGFIFEFEGNNPISQWFSLAVSSLNNKSAHML